MKRFFGSLLIALLATLGFVPVGAFANANAMQIQVQITDLDEDGVLSDDERRAGVPLLGTVNVTVDWGDGQQESFTTGGFKPHLYTAAGQYTISITGTLSHFGFDGNPSDRSDGAGGNAGDEMAKIIRVVQWGNLGLTSLEYGLAEATELVDVPADFPATVTNAHALFIRAEKFNDNNIVNWNVSNVEIFRSMFWDASVFNQSIGSWNTSSATDMGYMFLRARSFNQSLSGWNTSKVSQFNFMFNSASAFNQPIGNFDFSAVPNDTEIVLNLSQTAITGENFSATLVDWAAKPQPTGITLDVSRILTGAGVVAVRSLENDYNWVLTGAEANSPDFVVIESARNSSFGFSGLAVASRAAQVEGVNLGHKFSSFESFGEISLIEVGGSEVVIDKFDYVNCASELDGESVRIGDFHTGTHFLISCETVPSTLSNGTLSLTLTLEIKGSYLKLSAETLAITGTVGAVEIRIGGELASVEDTQITAFQDAQGHFSAIAIEQEPFAFSPVIGFQSDQAFVIRDSALGAGVTPAQGDGSVYFDFGAQQLAQGALLAELEVFVVDYFGTPNTQARAVSFARDVMDDATLGFGSCLSVVGPSSEPELIDQCQQNGTDPLTVNLADQVNGFFSSVGILASVGDEFIYEDAANYLGQPLDAKVIVVSDNSENLLVDRALSAANAVSTEWSLNTFVAAVSSEPVRTEFKIKLQDKSGNPVRVPSLQVNAFHVDREEFVEFSAIREYQLAENTELELSRADSGWSKFEETGLAFVDTLSEESFTKYRVSVHYQDVSEFSFAIGTDRPFWISEVLLDISAGPGWQSAQNPTGVAPDRVINEIDYPTFVPPSPTRVTSFSSQLVSPCEATVVTLRGEKLNTTSATIGGLSARVISSSDAEVVVEIPSGLRPGVVYDLILEGEGSLILQRAITVQSALCSQALGLTAWTKKQADGTIKVYAQGIVSSGKVQFMLNGREIAWVRAVDSTDPKLRFANGAHYLVRTIELAEGKNAIEIFVDGERVRRVAYTG